MAETKHTSERSITTQILLKDFYSVAEVAILLHCNRGRIYEMAERKVDPLPLRCCVGQKRNYIIQRDELIDWFARNYLYVAELKSR